MNFQYRTNGVCSRSITFGVEDDKVTSVTFQGGCDGNAKGVSCLVEGMPVDEAISRMKGIRCGMKGTSCPDQLARALETAKQQIEAGKVAAQQ